ncbi:MAG: hypothetical protein D6732_17400 [Methanobacteriota archaeon]|nr:MAG: hypothetical protein D6732_17400 [Euryarchaeota archaeon]
MKDVKRIHIDKDNGANHNQDEKTPMPKTPERLKPEQKKIRPCNLEKNCIVIIGKRLSPEKRRKERQEQERRARRILEMQLNMIRRILYYSRNPRGPSGMRFINQMPNGIDGPFISLINDDPDGTIVDQLVRDELADSIENAVVETGLDININSTTGGMSVVRMLKGELLTLIVLMENVLMIQVIEKMSLGYRRHC